MKRNTEVFESEEFREMTSLARTMTEPPQQDGSLRQAWYINRARELVAERENELGRKLTACVVTFGCQMNERDSEKLRGILQLAGLVDDIH